MKDAALKALGPPTEWDNTMIQTGCSCSRRLYWFLRRLDTRFPPAYFAYGRAWGAALNEWHGSQDSDLSAWERLAFALYAAEEEWNKEQMAPPQGENTIESLRLLLKMYVDAYGEREPWSVAYRKEGKPIGEIGFQVPIPQTSLIYCGSLDCPISWPGYGLLVREDKTTGDYITQAYISQWDHASQITGYLWAFGEVLGEEPFGAYMNIASKKNRKDPDLRFSRVLQKRSSWEVARFMRDTTLIIDDFRREWDLGSSRGWLWPKTGERDPIQCAGGMGRSACLYRDICKQEMDPWEMEELYPFEQNFIWREPWQPWNRAGANE
jgi:hypothetical protein